MSKLDIAKGQIAYLKFWLGVMVVTDISLVGWLISNSASAPTHKALGCFIGICVITLAGFNLHRRIQSTSGLWRTYSHGNILDHHTRCGCFRFRGYGMGRGAGREVAPMPR